MLDGSLTILDICSTTRDVLVQSKGCVLEIQSVLRTRCSGELNIASEVAEYLSTRKTIKKVLEINQGECFLKETKDITWTSLLHCYLTLAGGIKSQSSKSWSLVAKLTQKRSEKEVSVTQTNEFDVVDATLESIVCQKKTIVNIIEIIRNQILSLESQIQDFDQVLECLFRHLVKTRSTLLNILSN
ncbi:uncharacterized protein LOC141620532 [Silene latifolia]|uniref:uncharacterized protein LOC141620532 n=1 Tax=Silene latifolia TaxID=37657 RepID=UPI003D779C64